MTVTLEMGITKAPALSFPERGPQGLVQPYRWAFFGLRKRGVTTPLTGPLRAGFFHPFENCQALRFGK